MPPNCALVARGCVLTPSCTGRVAPGPGVLLFFKGDEATYQITNISWTKFAIPLDVVQQSTVRVIELVHEMDICFKSRVPILRSVRVERHRSPKSTYAVCDNIMLRP